VTEACALCGSRGVFLDEVLIDDLGARMFVCSDTDHCEQSRPSQEAAE
jgi:alpha-D-ribose 1-methylphosphonate 5-phosphate C-P lyase